MGKISPVSSKYIVHISIHIDGVVDRPDVIGAIFGQTEGLLGSDLELRELQRSGRIGRIEVNTEIKSGKTEGMIIVPSSLDKEETVIIAAALETMQRIGPCNARVRVEKIEDVRITKRNYVIERAKELLKKLTDEVLPDSAEITEEVAKSVRMMGVTEYGQDKLPAGPYIAESEEIILVEGRADVLNLLRHSFKNAIALNGTNVPQTIIELCEQKEVILFVDGDRGGDLIIKEVMGVCDVDFVTKAPDGKEVEELTKKEMHKALRSKITAEQAKLDLKEGAFNVHSRPQSRIQSRPSPRPMIRRPIPQRPAPRIVPRIAPRVAPRNILTKDQKDKFRQLLEDLIGTGGAYILDEKLSVLGKVPMSELVSTVKSLKTGMFALIFDGTATKEILLVAERASISYVISMDAEVKPVNSKVMLLTGSELK
ncbi:MAG: DNA primase [Nanoarchaeota archaeon]|nr:DNA primase [Nanoarchaeota archaeon]MBU4352053.1 DNA primase [Nanoarchaeota archaeon]